MADGREVDLVRTEPEGEGNGWLLIYAPGAGSSLRDRFGAFLAQELAPRGITVWRFQFPYMREGKRRPDRPAVLEAAWSMVIENARSAGKRLVVGGRSMGGRIASQVVAGGVGVDAVALFAYPLHPPGNPSKARVAHLGDIGAPTLFCSGTRDDFGTPDELTTAAQDVRDHTVHLLDGADHSFKTLKASGKTEGEVWREALDTFTGWLLKLQSK